MSSSLSPSPSAARDAAENVRRLEAHHICISSPPAAYLHSTGGGRHKLARGVSVVNDTIGVIVSRWGSYSGPTEESPYTNSEGNLQRRNFGNS